MIVLKMKIVEKKNNTLVIGLGNLLMSDEGIGCHAIEYLSNSCSFQGLDFLDGGTGGFHLMGYFTEYEHVVLIDATLDDLEEGTVRVIRPKASGDFPSTLSTHEIGLRDLITSLLLTDQLPDLYLIAVSVKDYANLSMELSERIRESLPVIKDKLKKIVHHLSLNPINVDS